MCVIVFEWSCGCDCVPANWQACFNPTLDGGGSIQPTPRISGCNDPNIDLGGTKFWYNSYFILTMDILNVLNLEGVPKKNLKYVFWSRGQKSKFETWSDCTEILQRLVGYQYKLFVFSGPYWFRPILKKYSHFKEKNGYILETKPEQKNCHCAKKF